MISVNILAAEVSTRGGIARVGFTITPLKGARAYGDLSKFPDELGGGYASIILAFGVPTTKEKTYLHRHICDLPFGRSRYPSSIGSILSLEESSLSYIAPSLSFYPNRFSQASFMVITT
jgi:hypothetical protein